MFIKDCEDENSQNNQNKAKINQKTQTKTQQNSEPIMQSKSKA